MPEVQITVSILSWLLEDRLIRTLSDLPRTTSMPLNLCLHVQGSEQIMDSKRKEIIDAASGFVHKDIFFTDGNKMSAKPRAELLKRSAITPYVFMTDNDMVFQPNSLDTLYSFLQNNKEYGIVDLVHNFLKGHRTVSNKTVNYRPVDLRKPHVVDVDLIGAGSMLIRSEICTIPDIIDTRYDISAWDLDFCLNVKAKGWKIGTYCDKKLVAVNDITQRTPKYLKEKVHHPIRLEGLKLFEKKWGFTSEYRPHNPTLREFPDYHDVAIISRAIYNRFGDDPGIGVLTPYRLELLQTNFIDSLKHQSDKDFNIYLVVGHETNETTQAIQALDWGNLKVSFIYTSDDMSAWKTSVEKSRNYGQEMDAGCPERLACNSGHPFANIMARLDTDDWVAPGWVAHMRHTANKFPQSHFLINYQVIGQAPDGRIYRFFAPHNRGRTSPFIALVQKASPRISPYADIHLKMGEKFSHVYTVPPAYAFMVIHDGNRSNRLYPGDRYIEAVDERKVHDFGNIQVVRNPTHNIAPPPARPPSWRDRSKILQTGAQR